MAHQASQWSRVRFLGYPYPFVDVITHGYALVFVNAGLVVVVLLVVTAVFWVGDRRLPPPLRASSLPTHTSARPASG